MNATRTLRVAALAGVLAIGSLFGGWTSAATAGGGGPSPINPFCDPWSCNPGYGPWCPPICQPWWGLCGFGSPWGSYGWGYGPGWGYGGGYGYGFNAISKHHYHGHHGQGSPGVLSLHKDLGGLGVGPHLNQHANGQSGFQTKATLSNHTDKSIHTFTRQPFANNPSHTHINAVAGNLKPMHSPIAHRTVGYGFGSQGIVNHNRPSFPTMSRTPSSHFGNPGFVGNGHAPGGFAGMARGGSGGHHR